MYARLLTILICTTSLSACMVGPDYTSPELALATSYRDGSGKGVPIKPETAWWATFQDKRLTSFVNTGLQQNLDVLQALEKISEARSNIVVAKAGALPSLSGAASGTGSGEDGKTAGVDTSETTLTGSGDFSVSWLVDLFGKYRRNTEAAVASLGAAYADADTARLTLLSDLTTEYINARLYQEQLAITRETVESRKATMALTNEKLQVGAATGLDVAQAEGLLKTAEADLPGYSVSFKQSAYQIAYLLGQNPDTVLQDLQKGAVIPRPHFNVNLGVPADILRNRPDIKSAERSLASATASIGVAEADLYPSLSLSGSIGISASVISSSPDSLLRNWSFGPSLSIPIFQGGELKANVDIAKSQAQQQYLSWRSTVLNGAKEVQSALTAYREQNRQIAALAASVDAYKRALDLSRQSYQSGASSFLDVLDAERSWSDARLNLASAQATRAKYFITLCVAAGGGYAQKAPSGPALVADGSQERRPKQNHM
ncbi:efflux transporter outer membrane subunit [Agrobacterium leguminum]|uniref:efflux transporter outer membrane subunit n=1 Tax=Agrobacterium leguminum TaxID=2792015 RepID=UPI003CE52E52